MIRPWFKWWPRDWRADPRLRLCSLAARGLWIEMLGYMHEAEPYGHLLIDGRPPTVDSISALVGRPIKEVKKALDELENQGVFSRDSDQRDVIFSRRMVRDNVRAEEGREHISKRWGTREPNRPPNRSPGRPPNRSPTGDPITQKPEEERRKEERKNPSQGEETMGGTYRPPLRAIDGRVS